MALTYAQWLAKNRLTSSTANAANWKRQYGTPAPAAPAAPEPVAMPAAPPPPPAFDPNYIDAQGQGDLSNLNATDATTRANAARSYSLATANTAAQRPGIERNRVLGRDNVQSNAAARGMFRSGNRLVGEGRVDTDAAEQNAALQRQDDQSAFERDAAYSGANNALALGRSGVYAQAGQRRLDQYRTQWGV